METTENSNVHEQMEMHKLLKSRYKRDSITFLEMSNILNWVISLVTALFLLFINKFFVPNNCHNSWFLELFGILYFALILIYVLYKLVYISYKRVLDNILTTWEADLFKSKSIKLLNSETLLNVINENIRLLNLISKEIFQLHIYNVKSKNQFQKTKLDCYVIFLKYSYYGGILIALLTLAFVPSYYFISTN